MRISTTTLEAYRLFLTQDWMGEADLIATITGTFVPTPAVRLGKAFGQILEAPEIYEIPGGYQCGGFTFDDQTMRGPLALIDRRGIFEAKATKRYGDCDVVAKADHLLGAHLTEFKTTGSTFHFEKYADSYQWRFMVDIFEPLEVTYHIFLLDDHGNGVVEVKGTESFNLFPYADLHRDCQGLVSAFAEYVTAKGLDGILRQRQVEAA